MRTYDIARRAGRGLKNAKARTVLTSLAIAVGAFTLTASLAAGTGAREYANDLIQSNVEPDSLFIVKDKSIIGQGGGQQSGLREYDPDVSTAGRAGATVKQLNADDIASLRSKKFLTDVRPIYSLNADYITFDDKEAKYTSELSIYNPDVLNEHVAGKKYQKGQDLKEGEAVVPEDFAKALKIDTEDLVGKKVSVFVSRDPRTISESEISRVLASEGTAGLANLSARQSKRYDFTIKQVVKTSELSFSLSTALQIPIEDGTAISEYVTEGTSNYQKYFAATAKVANGTTPEEAKGTLEKDGLFPQTADDLQGFLFTIVNVLQGIVFGFGIIALIASIFGIINTQYISVLERTREIGLMKALGMSGGAVSRLFQFEAAWIGLLGGVLGAGAAVVVGTLLNPWITTSLDLGKSSLLIFEPLPIACLIAGLVIVAMLAGWFPARKAAKLDPIEALRTE